MLAGMVARLPALALVLSVLLGPPVRPQDAVPRPSILGAISKPYQLNNPVLEFRLPDLDGKEHELAGARDERALVVVFWSFRDGPSRFYVPALTKLRETHGERLALYLVNSNVDELVGGNADPLDRLRKWVKDEHVTLTILLDRENVVADDFGAKANGEVFLVDGNHVLRYHGGVDDDPDGKKAEAGKPVATWLADALGSVLSGGLPEVPLTVFHGRQIKRVKKDR